MRVLLPSALACLLFLAGTPAAAGNAPDDDTRMRLAAEQLVRTQLPSGLFTYEFDIATGERSDPVAPDGVVLVRESFAAYALARYGARFDYRPALDAVRRFLGNAAERSLPIGKGEYQSRLEAAGLYNQPFAWMFLQTSLNLFGLLYSTDGAGQLLSADGSYQQAYPGATALALAAGLYYQAASGDGRFDDLLRHWAQGLLAVQLPGRGFREAPHHLAESDYLNGEGWLALALYAEAYPQDAETAGVLGALDDYLLGRYANSPSRQFYHWGSMAAARRAAMSGERRFDDFLASLTGRYLARNVQLPDGTSNSCHVVEGLASFAGRAETLQGADSLNSKARERIVRLMAQNRQLQIHAGMKLSTAPGERGARGLEEYSGGFLSSVEPPRMRLDFTGHCLNAMLIMEHAGLSGETGYSPDMAGR